MTHVTRRHVRSCFVISQRHVDTTPDASLTHCLLAASTYAARSRYTFLGRCRRIFSLFHIRINSVFIILDRIVSKMASSDGFLRPLVLLLWSLWSNGLNLVKTFTMRLIGSLTHGSHLSVSHYFRISIGSKCDNTAVLISVMTKPTIWKDSSNPLTPSGATWVQL